jgi:hypothetical protein
LVALYELQKRIIRKGYDCVYYSEGTESVARHEVTDDDVVVYPEVIRGNPVGAKNVVRWLLNLPGVCGGDGQYKDTDLVVSYLPQFDHPMTRAHLFVPNWDPAMLRDLGLPRKGSLVWVHKGGWKPRIPLEGLEITHQSGLSKKQLVHLLQTSETLYSYDDCTALALEAHLCGCKVKLVNADGSITPYPLGLEDLDRWLADVEPQLDAFIKMTQEM